MTDTRVPLANPVNVVISSNLSLIEMSVVLALVLIGAELLYFRIADRFNIIDKPNARSSHTTPIIRGGGIIFIVAVWVWLFYSGGKGIWFGTGITAIAVISFFDDIISLRPGLRFIVHLSAVLSMFYEVGLFHWPLALTLLALIVSIGALNAFNFMDGINGITGIYALVSLVTFWYVDQHVTSFTDVSLIISGTISVLVFLFFNFRKRARCFAGDVGSITIAYVQIFLLLQLIYATDNLFWVMMVLVYGVDAVITIVYRLRRKENIFAPHRTHLYQYLANEFQWDHRAVSLLYGTIQLLINLICIYFFQSAQFVWVVVVAFVLVLNYIGWRAYVTRKLRPSGYRHP